MSLAQIMVTAAGGLLVLVLSQFFFRARKATDALVGAAGQEATVVVMGGCQPNMVRARRGPPLRLTFDRREDGDCSARVVFADLGVNRLLPPFKKTTVDVYRSAGDLRLRVRHEHAPWLTHHRRRTRRG